MQTPTPQLPEVRIGNIKFAWHSRFITMTDDEDPTNVVVLHIDEWEKTRKNIDNIVAQLKTNKETR